MEAATQAREREEEARLVYEREVLIQKIGDGNSTTTA